METPVVFDQEALKKRVSESVSASFGMLIPQDQWNALIEREVKAFFETEVHFDWDQIKPQANAGYGYGHTPAVYGLKLGMTPFRQIVWKKVTELCVAEIEKVLTSDKFMGHIPDSWSRSNGDSKLNEVMEQKLNELAPKMAAEFFRTGFIAALDNIKTTIREDIRNGR